MAHTPNAQALRAALGELCAGGIGNILLIAGDAPRPVGEFSSTLDVLKSGILARWERERAHRRVHLPVRVGIAGPASLAKLVHFAIQCGIGASVRALTRNLSTLAHSISICLPRGSECGIDGESRKF